jgi:P4 family phage/plasmid primase-like protien
MTFQIKSHNSQRPPNDVTRLLNLLGEDVVMLSIPLGQKRPVNKNWQETPLAKMQDPDYLRRLTQGNIGILQGEPSGGLCSIDIDSDEDAREFLKLNPELPKTLLSKGKRGCNIWVRIRGDCPPLTKLRRKDVWRTPGQEDDDQWGEWRSTGGQTVICGQHPSGVDYQITNEAKPIEIDFKSIKWPDGLNLTWDFDLYNELVKRHGQPFVRTKKSVRLNQFWFVAKFAVEHVVLYEPDERQFYLYDEAHGLWRPATDDSIKEQFALDLKSYADSQHEPQIELLRTNSLLSGLTEMLKGHVERREAFKHKRGVIHLKNGMLHLDVQPPELREFSPNYYSRNQCPIPLVEGATCPLFESELLASALNPEDISLTQRGAGAILLGGNSAQRLILFMGTAGGGKSTLVAVIEHVVGPENVTELRTDQLHERFEAARFIGKVLLTGKDVPAEFLRRKGASNIKKLVGHDLLSAERKQSNAVFYLRGEFYIIITCNSRLRVYLEGDADAWRRRLIVIEYDRPKPKDRISDFHQKLIAQEGPGILNWMIQGAILHLRELETCGDFVLTQAQQDRVEALLAESDSVREFVKTWLHTSKGDITLGELHQGYEEFCRDTGYPPVAPHQAAGQMKQLIAEIHSLHLRNDIWRFEGHQRGFKGLEITQPKL